MEHSAFQPGYAPGYKQAVLGHTVTMAAAPCSGPPEYTCPPQKSDFVCFCFKVHMQASAKQSTTVHFNRRSH